MEGNGPGYEWMSCSRLPSLLLIALTAIFANLRQAPTGVQGPGGGGCLLEQTWGGSKEISLEGGDTRRYLEDGDTVTLSGYCQGEGFRVGFGECKGKILPALAG